MGVGDWWLGTGEWGLVPALAAPAQVGVETHTRGVVSGKW